VYYSCDEVLPSAFVWQMPMDRDILRVIMRNEYPQMINCLDSLLDEAEKHGTFHDARVVEAQERESCTTIRFSMCVGDPDATCHAERERWRAGTLVLHGVYDRSFDPPNVILGNAGSTWLTADGPIDQLDSDAARQFADRTPSDLVRHYMYFSDTNAFMFVACRQMEFSWC